MEQESKKSRKSVMVPFVIVLVAVLAAAYLFAATACQEKDSTDELETVDLTTMSSTMVYAYVNDMVNTRPEDYLGKTIKARGQHEQTYYEPTGQYYHFVVISDATSCCAQGIEFEYAGEYPDINTEIVIVGTFETYDELGITYYFIRVVTLEIVS